MVHKTFMVGVLGIVLFLTEKRNIWGDAKTSVSYSHLYLLLKASQNIFKSFEFVHPTKHRKQIYRKYLDLQTNQQVDIKRSVRGSIFIAFHQQNKKK